MGCTPCYGNPPMVKDVNCRQNMVKSSQIKSNHDPKATFLWFPPNGRRAMCDFSSCNGLELTCRHDMEQLKLKTQQRGNYSFIKICSSPMLEHFKIIFKNPILIYFVPSNFTPYPSVIITLLVRHNFYV